MRMPDLTDEQAAENARMRQRSGHNTTRDPLVTFLYLLMRDDVAFGLVEKHVRDTLSDYRPDESVLFTNGWLADYAKDIAERLRPKQED